MLRTLETNREVDMRCKSCLTIAFELAILAGIAAVATAGDLTETLRTIRAVGPEGKGNKDAARAWKELVREKALALPEILAALDDANPIAANYLRSAVE